MSGRWALMGGAEFQPACDGMDRVLLASIGRPRPHVAVLPTAAQQNPALAAANGVQHFQRLGAEAEAVMVVDAASADEAGLSERLLGADLIYLCGGDPAYLLQSLSGTRAQETLERASEHGALIAGSSAGAMVLGAVLLNGTGEPRPALGLAGPFAVLPHYSPAWQARAGALAAALPPDILLLGLPETAGISGGDGVWQVQGGAVHCWRSGAEERLSPGELLRLESAGRQ